VESKSKREFLMNFIYYIFADMAFILEHTDSRTEARCGVFETEHGRIETPIFMPVGTAGTVKAVSQSDLTSVVNAQIILGNTYHLYLRPGIETIEKAGGLHAFMNWSRPLLTDSGGYQVFSLSGNRKITEEGYFFQSHIDGSSHVFTPEKVVDIQRVIGSDIMMVLDECPPFPSDHGYAEKSLELTHRWLERATEHFSKTGSQYGFEQYLFPIVQGSTFPDLRKKAAETISSMDFEGYAIGGLSVGEPEDLMYEMTRLVNTVLPTDKPRYLMGVGTPANIIESVGLGVDMFDCVMPTRNGRNGMLFTSEGIINIKNQKWKNNFSPLDDAGLIPFSQNYSKAYLRHLIISKEMLGAHIASMHNLCFYMWLVQECRAQILKDTFSSWKDQMLPKLMRRL